jgi:GH43 family beta-xylosidase
MAALKPLIHQRADPHIHRHGDGYYYFTGSVPAYDGIEIRRARSVAELAEAEPVMVWRKPETGPLSDLIWAPEIHYHRDSWYVYFAAAPNREIKDGLFQHRMYAISTSGANPLTGTWSEPVRIETHLDTFSLDATTFEHEGTLYYLWAQKDPVIPGNSNLYLAPMATPVTLSADPVMLSKPEYDWEKRGFLVNEGPAVIRHNGLIHISYSASATDENYCVGLLSAESGADLMDPASWTKSEKPVFRSDFENGIYGPGHNSFTRSENGRDDLLVYHARTYTEIEGDPLWDPNRHTFVKPLKWSSRGMPLFGSPATDD